ncbi:hypothetical protein [Rubrivirga sp. SAORIC476]|uniref:hypothetical protein n=1 Tax=Rubrivirga sp. SAORIC476 TaxID=1961794 RepID=UPI0013042523|nr:hypothetical protein [Rubrivirga sp. SAORIC476]
MHNQYSTLLPLDDLAGFTFARKPVSVPADLRLHWRIAETLLVLRLCSFKSSSSVMKLQLFNWALRNQEVRARVIAAMSGAKPSFGGSVLHLDPAVNRAVDFSLATGLTGIGSPGKIKLLEKGRDLADRVLEDDTLLSAEKAFLTEIGKKISEAKLSSTINALF